MLETFFPELETKSAKPELETKKIRNSYYKQKLKYNQELTRITQEVREKLKQDISKIDSSSIEIELDHKGLYITDSIYQKIKELNIDWFILIVGLEGSGKSSLALNLFARFCQLSNYSIPDTLLRTLIYDEDELLRFISTLSPEEKYLPILLDEGANILFNRESMNVKRNYILKFFNVMRFLNSIMIICSPNIKFIDKNVKTHRVKSVFYIPQRGVYWYYDKQQLDVMLKNETTRTWKWIEPKIVGSYSVNKTLEEMTTLIKKSYVKMFSEKIKLYLETQDSNIKP